MLVSIFVRKQAAPAVKSQNRDDLAALKKLAEAGKIKPVIDGTYSLSETPKAIARVATGRARGTIVITVLDAQAAVGSADKQPVAVAARAVA
jgi:NADPH:quinone reductase-like Zn-dependent oxidoreductase